MMVWDLSHRQFRGARRVRRRHAGRLGLPYHLEFTRKAGHPAGRAPTQDNLLVFSIPEPRGMAGGRRASASRGHEPVPSFNPYWDRGGRTFEDPDGYRVVLQNAAWPRQT